jgi:hypothetical protein
VQKVAAGKPIAKRNGFAGVETDHGNPGMRPVGEVVYHIQDDKDTV